MFKVKQRFWIILTFFIVSLFGWIYYEDEIFIQLTVFFSLIIIVSYLWSLFSVIRIDVIRKSRYLRQNVGEYFEEYFEIKNQLPIWRFWLEITDHSNLPGYQVSRVISTLGPNQSRNFNSYTLLKNRGVVHLGPISITSGDPFGFFQSGKQIENRSVLLILPFYASLSEITQHFGMLLGGNSLRKPSLETTPHAAGIREYLPGDPLNRIHWPSTMKRNQIMVKEFDQDPQTSVWIYLDAHQMVHYSQEFKKENEPEDRLWLLKKRTGYQLPCDSFEYAVSTAATLADFFVKQGRSVGLCCSGKNTEILSSDKGERQLTKILELLTFIHPDGDLPIFRFVESNIGYQNLGTTVIIITTTAAVELLHAAEIIKQKGLYPIFVVLDANSFGLKNDAEIEKKELTAGKISSVVIKYGDSIKDVLQKDLS